MDKPLQRVPQFQLLLTDPQFRAIGHVIVQWAFLESEITSEMAWLLGRREHKGKQINFQARFSTLSANWQKLATRSYCKQPERIAEVNRIVGRANQIKKERDNLAHGTFGSSGIFFKTKNGRIIQISDTIGTPTYIEDLACRISEISAELFKHQRALNRYYRKRP